MLFYEKLHDVLKMTSPFRWMGAVGGGEVKFYPATNQPENTKTQEVSR
jgi:hypothetical protein